MTNYSWIPKIKKKIKTLDSGVLLYPHDFKLGQLVRFKELYKNLGKEQGYGIVTMLKDNGLQIFWQVSGKYFLYDCATANLYFDIIVDKK